MSSMMAAIYRQIVRSNLHPLDDSGAWRMARRSTSPARFSRSLEGLGIRCAIDLRRSNRSDESSQQIDFESMGIQYHNLHLRASDLPHPEPLQKLMQVMADGPRPILLYCKRGKDKTGFASALYRHSICGDSLEVAWKQLRFIPFGHSRKGHEGPYRFRELLEQHQPVDLLRWIDEVYPEIFEEGVARGEIRSVLPTGWYPET